MKVRILGLVLMTLGVTGLARAQDFDVNLIGDPIATTVQLPTFGVSFDAEGVLQLKTFTDPTGQLVAQRVAAARAAVPGDLARPVAKRKVSLVRLQAAVKELRRRGEPPTDAMEKLAGLTRITEAYCYPDTGDIVIAGPAEPWIGDLAGRAVGMRSGLPTLLLGDLAVAIRAYAPESDHRGFVGCTINPRADGLAKFVQFQRTIPHTIPQSRRAAITQHVSRGIKESLGTAEVKVFGVSGQTNFARVMIEADYRMKRMAIGVEQPPVPITTYAAALKTAANGVLERWWFTPDYEGLRASPDRLAMKLTGQGVQLQTENKAIGSNGAIADAGRKPTRATLAFAGSFTRRYTDIAKVSPIYAQLRQLTDWLVLAAFLREHRWYARTGWDAALLVDETIYSVDQLPQPMTAPVVVNTFWKGNRMFTPAGGGVSIEAEKALELMLDDEDLRQPQDDPPPDDPNRWWWD